ncbi:MAG: hypothetical protein NC548_52365 [Lachnospiraceae bacterium]|nr:hypothetical protein [Lachnospiraceae bacterium]
MKELNEILRSEAIGLGLCQQWQSDWRANKNTGELIEMFKRGIDFCLEHRWPSCEFIKANFDKVELHDHNVYVGENVTGTVLSDGVAVIRECNGVIHTGRNSVTTIHCQDSKIISIKAGRGARVFLHLYNSTVERIEEDMHSVVKVYNHNDL